MQQLSFLYIWIQKLNYLSIHWASTYRQFMLPKEKGYFSCGSYAFSLMNQDKFYENFQ